MTDVMSRVGIAIDDLLGAAEKRFFGSGYRRIGQRVSELSWDPERRTLRATAGVLYPSDWSVKEAGAPAPHLSTIDALVFGARLSEAALTAAHGLTSEQRRGMWLRRVEIRAGGAPDEQGLEAFPVSAELRGTEVAPLSALDQVSLVVCRVGRMTVRCTVEHRPGGGPPAGDDGLLGPSEQRPYGDGYQAHHQRIGDVLLNVSAPAPEVSATVSLACGPEAVGTQGLEGAYQPGTTLVDAFVVALQLGQVLLYELDRVPRAGSGTLWMRRTVLEAASPYRAAAQDAPANAVLENAAVVETQGSHWRNADIVAEYGGVRVLCSVTHRLPEHPLPGRPLPEADGSGR